MDKKIKIKEKWILLAAGLFLLHMPLSVSAEEGVPEPADCICETVCRNPRTVSVKQHVRRKRGMMRARCAAGKMRIFSPVPEICRMRRQQAMIRQTD